MPFKNLSNLLPLGLALPALLLLFLSGCSPQPDTYVAPVSRTPRPGSWSSNHKPAPPPPSGKDAIGSPGESKALFVDMAAKAGLNYRWSIPGPRPLDILQTIGNGCAFLDYNNDGNLDILLVGPKLALYKGDGHGLFTDVTHAMGLDKLHGHFLGCAVGDYDNDGYDDLYISGYRTGLLLHNEHGTGFRDVTQQAGLKPQPWGTSAAFADIDNDGKLDLYVGDYVQFDPKTSKRFCPKNSLPVACPPQEYLPEHGVLYHNEGNGKFRDCTNQWDTQASSGKTLGVAFADYNGSGRPSLYLANDTMPGDLFQNIGKNYRDIGRQSGTAFGASFLSHAGMGTDWADYDNDGRLDLFTAAFQGEPKTVFHNEGDNIFQERSSSVLIALPTQPYVAFGAKWLDFDNDGWLDLMIANGHVYDNVASFNKTATYREPTQLFRNDHGRIFVDLTDRAGPDLPRPIVGRGLAIGDFDNDGRMDALVVDSEGAPLLLHNESAPVGHWLSLKLVGTRSNRDGIGAMVTVTAGGLTQKRFCHTDGSYLSASDVRVHLGLGKAAFVLKMSVKWPSGHVDVFSHVRANQHLRLREGDKTLISVTG